MNEAKRLVYLSLFTTLFSMVFFYVGIQIDILIPTLFFYILGIGLLVVGSLALFNNYLNQRFALYIFMIIINIFVGVIFTFLTISII